MFSRSDARFSAEDLRRGTKALFHRGPDAHNQWISKDGRVGLGHTRLSIIDLAGGDQPIANEDHSAHIVVNGEVYDFERIQRELTEAGHRLRTKSDSEVILHLYEDLGVQCLEELRGEYAFVVWDQRNQTLFAARDRFGIKPLYYAVHRDVLYLASEVKALFAAGVPGVWDDESAFNMTNFVVHSGSATRTLFKGIYQVPAAHYLIATKNSLQVRRYWDIDYPDASGIRASSRDEREWEERLHGVLSEAVRLRMRADVPVGCYLSGGLDSCATLGMATKFTPKIRAFTLSFDHKDYDERSVAEEMANFAGADFHPIDVTQDSLVRAFEDAVHHSETLFFNAHGVAKFLLSKHVRDAGYKVVLTGEGADEVFAGYAHYRRDMLLYNSQGEDPEWIQSELRELHAANRVSAGTSLPHGQALNLESVRRVLGFVPSWFVAFGSIGMNLQGLLAQDFKARHSGDPYRYLLSNIDVRNQLRGRDAVTQSLYLWAALPLQSYILNVLGDRMEMAHSIEGRVPFLDHKVVELVRDMPTTQKIRGRAEKYVLREAAKRYITPTVYQRHKHPFRVPPSMITMRGPMSQLINDTLRGTAFGDLPFFDQSKVIAMLDRIPKMDTVERVALDAVLMVLMSASVLQQRFSLGSSSEPAASADAA
jgi:asparagine synthase (glutamine-hydrolysing)